MVNKERKTDVKKSVGRTHLLGIRGWSLMGGHEKKDTPFWSKSGRQASQEILKSLVSHNINSKSFTMSSTRGRAHLQLYKMETYFCLQISDFHKC